MTEACVSDDAPCKVASLHPKWVPVVLDPDIPARPCSAGDFVLGHHDRCVVDTRDGQYLGVVTGFCSPITTEPPSSSDRVIRIATAEDEQRTSELTHLEREIRDHLRRRSHDLGIEMKPLKVRVSLGGRRAVVFFSSEKRVDFRDLVRDLGRRYRRRIEMRPLGVRDAARTMGGIGPCGRCVCCTTFMRRFHSVTVRMAKRQNLSLNPTKISGLCGRLMCCLAHEVEQYPDANRRS